MSVLENAKADVESIYESALAECQEILEGAVMVHMQAHPDIAEFCDCQGSTSCTMTDGTVWGSWERDDKDAPEHVQALFDLLDTWDGTFKGSSGLWIVREGSRVKNKE